jgi:hypothetical protein
VTVSDSFLRSTFRLRVRADDWQETDVEVWIDALDVAGSGERGDPVNGAQRERRQLGRRAARSARV